MNTGIAQTPAALRQALAATGYIADEALATTLYLAITLARPLLVEGPAGVGKTEIAKALATLYDRPLHRLSCYEGLDAASALYDWDYPRQLMAIRLAEARGETPAADHLYSDRYLLARPVLAALQAPGQAILLIDELDRADEAVEALLLEVLAEAQITIPEYATIAAQQPPIVIVTGNRSRELSDALRRRCLYLWIDYPDAEQEFAVLQARLPHIDTALARQISDYLAGLRERDLAKPPGLAETLDWARALMALGVSDLAQDRVPLSLGTLLKEPADMQALRAEWPRIRPT